MYKYDRMDKLHNYTITHTDIIAFDCTDMTANYMTTSTQHHNNNTSE